MTSQILKRFLCGSAGCCITTSASEEEFDSTYKKFEENELSVSNTSSLRITTLNNENKQSKDELEETDFVEYPSEKEKDEDDLPTWRDEDLCDLHRIAIRERRQSLSLSNLIDLSEQETINDNTSMSSAEKRCTFPPSRRKNGLCIIKRSGMQRNTKEIYQIPYNRLNQDKSSREDVDAKSSSSDISTASTSLSGSVPPFEWDYMDFQSNHCFRLHGMDEEKPTDRCDFVGDSYTLYNVNRCPFCKVDSERRELVDNQTLVHLFI